MCKIRKDITNVLLYENGRSGASVTGHGGQYGNGRGGSIGGQGDLAGLRGTAEGSSLLGPFGWSLSLHNSPVFHSAGAVNPMGKLTSCVSTLNNSQRERLKFTRRNSVT